MKIQPLLLIFRGRQNNILNAAGFDRQLLNPKKFKADIPFVDDTALHRTISSQSWHSSDHSHVKPVESKFKIRIVTAGLSNIARVFVDVALKEYQAVKINNMVVAVR
jgi:hypothetical protein